MQDIPIPTIELFPVLDTLLIELLRSLTADEWQAQTVAKRWKVKDVASHLLDGNLRGLSISRDKYYGESTENIRSYQDLLDFLNQMNMRWTDATKRLSPAVLISLLEISGREYTQHISQLAPFDEAVFPVAWAGHITSPNWFHIAREYTEKFLHQQQIRDAVGKQALFTPQLYHPFINTFMYALPHTFSNISAGNGTIVSIEISTETGGRWSIEKINEGWQLTDAGNSTPNALVIIDPDTAWKLFSKSWRPADVMHKVTITGDAHLGRQALEMVSVMA